MIITLGFGRWTEALFFTYAFRFTLKSHYLLLIMMADKFDTMKAWDRNNVCLLCICLLILLCFFNHTSCFSADPHNIKLCPTQHDQIGDALFVAPGVGSVFADVLPLVAHCDIADLDGGTVQVWKTGREADPALQWRFGVVGVKVWMKHSDVDSVSVLWLIDPRHLGWSRSRASG